MDSKYFALGYQIGVGSVPTVPPPETQEKNITITENGTTEVTPDEGKLLAKVTVTTDVAGGGGGGGGSMEGFHKVQFFNDDRTTLLYTVFVPHGASAIYAGETPASTLGIPLFKGFEPSATNVTADLDCYAVYELDVGTLNETSWENIALLSRLGTAQNYFAVGDTKMIHIQGTVGTLEVNGDYGVYIIGFDHNEEIEGKGIHFGTFKTDVTNGKDICFVDDKNTKASTDGTKYFNMNHWGHLAYGGWRGCDLRYDVLGSTDVAPSGYGAATASGRTGYDATPTCATNPVANTLMAALPADLRAVMKPMIKYASKNNKEEGLTQESVVPSIDYLPYLSECEVFDSSTPSAYNQKRYAYFAAGNSVVKNKQSNTTSGTSWRLRTPEGTNNYFCGVYYTNGGYLTGGGCQYSSGLAPIFKV